MERIYWEGKAAWIGNPMPMRGFDAFSAAMSVCDADLDAHASRVATYAEAIAVRLGWEEERLESLRLGASLHDVGKINVRGEILAKPGRLDEAELAEIRAHPVEGAWLIAGVPSLAPALPYVLFHHERWDGLGYPTRRARREIPIEARILSAADAFDAMTSDRPYRPAAAVGDALDEVRRCSGSQFDPDVADVLVDVVEAGVAPVGA